MRLRRKKGKLTIVLATNIVCEQLPLPPTRLRADFRTIRELLIADCPEILIIFIGGNGRLELGDLVVWFQAQHSHRARKAKLLLLCDREFMQLNDLLVSKMVVSAKVDIVAMGCCAT